MDRSRELSEELTDAGTLQGTSPSGRWNAPRLRPSETIDRYVLLRRLGRGAMGVVWAAYDPQLERNVALKLVPVEGSRNVDKARERVLAEARALAKVTHPNVVAVHEVGVHDTGVYIAMELVEGLTIKDWIASRDPGWPAVLRAYAEVGQGLAALHALDLLHSDIKPSNIMVDVAEGGDATRARLLDFGLAQVAERGSSAASSASMAPRSSMTDRTRLRGTAAYMAPELHRGDPPDEKSDQFALCVSMWQGLCRHHPFGGESIQQVSVRIVSGEVKPPARGTKVPSWLLRVLRRGLAVNPAERWPSMDALLEALEQGRTTRRRTIAVIAVAGVGVTAGAVGLTASALEHAKVAQCQESAGRIDGVWNQEVRAEVERAFEGMQRTFASDAAQRTGVWLDRYTKAWRETWEAACRDALVEQSLPEPQWLAIQACLRDRKGEMTSFVTSLRQPTIELAQVATRTAGELPSVAACREPVRIAAWRTMIDAGVDLEPIERLRARLQEAASLVRARRFSDAERLATAVLEEARGLPSRPMQARALRVLASNLRAQQKAQDAYELLEEALVLAGAAGDDEQWVQIGLMLMAVSQGLARFDEAARWGRLTGMVLERMGATESELAADLEVQTAAVHSMAGHYAEAQTHLERAHTLAERLTGPRSPEMARIVHNLGTAAFRQGDVARARALWEQALQRKTEIFGPRHPSTARSLVTLGNTYIVENDLDRGQELYEQALEIQTEALGPKHSNVGQTLSNLINIANERGDYRRALELGRRAEEILVAAHGPRHPDTIRALINQAVALLNLGEGEATLELARRARTDLQAVDAQHPEVGAASNIEGLALLVLDRPQEAIVALERALEIIDENRDPDLFRDTRRSLARALVESGRELDRARTLLQGIETADLAPDEREELANIEAKLEAKLAESG